MSAPIPLIELSALPHGSGRRVRAVGLDLAVFRIGDAVYAIDDSCPHAGASLCGGRLQGRKIYCRAHGLGFDLMEDAPQGAASLPIRRYPLSIVEGVVMLDPQAVTSTLGA
jgi:3-phenylpropionate/trans-cinnamate dioxygenase ferredoxin component